jgi:CRISPR-associated protein Csm5
MNRIIDFHPLLLTPLAPIHIGSGEDLDWTRAVLDDRHMVIFDPLRVQLSQSMSNSLEKASAQKDPAAALLEMQRIFRQNLRALAQGEVSRIALTEAIANKFAGALGQNVQKKQPEGRGPEKVVNQISLARCITNPVDGRPLVPGSSLKGALRTAEVARRASDPSTGKDKDSRKKGDLAEALLDRFHRSPFARVMVSDLLATGRIVSLGAQVRNERRRYKRGGTNKGIPLAVELIPPFYPGAFAGDIRVAGQRGRGDNLPRIALGDLMRTCHAFHLKLFNDLDKILRQEERGLDRDWLGAMRKLLAAIEPKVAEGRAALVRIGKFCSAESKTVAERQVWIAQARQYKSSPTTIWLAEMEHGSLPLGWALIELAEKPSQAVIELCAALGSDAAPIEPDLTEQPAPPALPRIIPDEANRNRKLMRQLEDDCDKGRANDALLESLIKGSGNWDEEDRILLARLVHEKARAISKIQKFKWQQLERLLLKLPG